MDVTVSRRNHTYKKGNKENAQPAYGSKSFINRDKTSAAPFQLKSNKKEETLAKNGSLKAKQADTRSTSGEALKKVKTVQRDVKGATVIKQTHSQAFLTEQAVKDKRIIAEATKPPAAVPLSKPAPGMYKGKIVQSKIGSIWKSSAAVSGADLKPPAPTTESKRAGNVTKIRSNSVADLPGHGTQRTTQTRSKSVFDRQVSNPAAAAARPPAGSYSARPPARTVPATLTSTSSRNMKVVPSQRSGIQNSKPKIPVTDKKVNKIPVSSALSQYRFTVETAEERRAKLAEWLASKGKTFKRPAMTSVAPSKAKVSAKPEADLKSHADPQPAAQCNPEAEPSVEAHESDSSAAHCADTQGAELTIHSQTPVIMNTTLDLLENSEADLPVDPQDRVNDIVMNLCDVLEALELKNELSEQPKVEQVKDNGEESDQEGETDVEEVESDDEGVMETTPQMEDASVVKYSVKTTPYLQSVKKAIADDASTSTSRRKSNIKDLKFLTPVRRSCRIERKSCCLPAMLVDHDPCVSSLAELVKLDDDANAYIYRKNPALLEDLPDQPRL